MNHILTRIWEWDGGLNSIALTSIAALILLIAAVVIGSFTRALGAGLACGPDWPLCLGNLIPDISKVEIALEYFHRVVSGSAAIAVAYTAYLSFKLDSKYPGVKRWALITLLLVAFQVTLGMLVVKFELAPELSALHTSIAVLTVAFAAVTAVKAASYK